MKAYRCSDEFFETALSITVFQLYSILVGHGCPTALPLGVPERLYQHTFAEWQHRIVEETANIPEAILTLKMRNSVNRLECVVEVSGAHTENYS